MPNKNKNRKLEQLQAMVNKVETQSPKERRESGIHSSREGIFVCHPTPSTIPHFSTHLSSFISSKTEACREGEVNCNLRRSFHGTQIFFLLSFKFTIPAPGPASYRGNSSWGFQVRSSSPELSSFQFGCVHDVLVPARCHSKKVRRSTANCVQGCPLPLSLSFRSSSSDMQGVGTSLQRQKRSFVWKSYTRAVTWIRSAHEVTRCGSPGFKRSLFVASRSHSQRSVFVDSRKHSYTKAARWKQCPHSLFSHCSGAVCGSPRVESAACMCSRFFFSIKSSTAGGDLGRSWMPSATWPTCPTQSWSTEIGQKQLASFARVVPGVLTLFISTTLPALQPAEKRKINILANAERQLLMVPWKPVPD